MVDSGLSDICGVCKYTLCVALWRVRDIYNTLLSLEILGSSYITMLFCFKKYLGDSLGAPARLL